MQQYKSIDLLGKRFPSDLRQPYYVPHQMRWLGPNTKVCAIGSCFATNFSRWIALQNVPVISPVWGLHYNSRTIAEEIRKATGAQINRVIWKILEENGKYKYYDAKRHPVFADTEENLFQTVSDIEIKASVAVADADAFIITLGLSEIWEQRTNSGWEVLNRSPLSQHVEQGLPDVRSRFQSINEIITDLKEIVSAIDQTGGPIRPIVFTVSPVPLKTTGADIDARIANTRSKATLISALHNFLEIIQKPGRASVFYFPAYEQFQYTDTDEQIWQRDMRHIHASKIDKVCFSFCHMFADDPDRFSLLPDFSVPLV
ncbi:GSCFA domain-containing protein [Rickettsiella endosymbiont of Dermanyssus gallinae]|uniref:GSCFA domain-containing protein n=1 Tax=Rickettsiella endosymbiont of Dermanyssus gallinae TaxID=2856608 RepID=UPI001C52AF1A|nr:GSCFA domain-containing protein [Rickettsiella endosymbiont of Dermanyssus gallinae]